MAARFINLDRQTPMFLPCDLREWVPEDHIVHFILDAVEQLPTAHFKVNDRGTGHPQYPPTMMLALLIYCYATGRFGSRTIEAATHSDVAVRYLCANLHPDHSSICEFRAANEPAFRAAFVSVLQLAQELRLTKVGAVSVDGTKIQASASKHAAVSYRRAGELIAQLELEVQEFRQRFENRLPALIQFRQRQQPLADAGHDHLIQRPRGFLAVTGDEGHRGAFGEQPGRGGNLTGLKFEFAGNF
jgi:transposase